MTHGSIIQLLEILLGNKPDMWCLTGLTVLTYGNVTQLLQHGFQHGHETVAMQQRGQSFLQRLLLLCCCLIHNVGASFVS